MAGYNIRELIRSAIIFLNRPTAAASFIKCVYVVIVSLGTNQEWQLNNSDSKYYKHQLSSVRNCSHVHITNNITVTDDDYREYDSNRTSLANRYYFWLFFVMPVMLGSVVHFYMQFHQAKFDNPKLDAQKLHNEILLRHDWTRLHLLLDPRLLFFSLLEEGTIFLVWIYPTATNFESKQYHTCADGLVIPIPTPHDYIGALLITISEIARLNIYVCLKYLKNKDVYRGVLSLLRLDIFVLNLISALAIMGLTGFIVLRYTFRPTYYYDFGTHKWRNNLVEIIEEYDTSDACNTVITGAVNANDDKNVRIQDYNDNCVGVFSMSALHTQSVEPEL